MEYKKAANDKLIAIAGNPNVGKSTLFNNLTGKNQHTGNWPGKTVTSATGYFQTALHSYILVDIPGTYSLMAHSPEEEAARNFLCFGKADAAIVVCDATCLERNLNLVLQTMELVPRVLVCVNLMDEAKRRHIQIDLANLSENLDVPVIGTTARDKKSLYEFTETLDQFIDSRKQSPLCPVTYAPPLESALAILEPLLHKKAHGALPARWLALRLLDTDSELEKEITTYLGQNLSSDPAVCQALSEAWSLLAAAHIQREEMQDLITTGLIRRAEQIYRCSVQEDREYARKNDQKLDRFLTDRRSGYPVMLLLLAFVFWLTITGANYPSRLLSHILFSIQDLLTRLFYLMNAPAWLHDVLVLGAYRVLAWVVSVMLPPMAIFFPLFTLLEDSGYLPRIAYNLDHVFCRCHSCGKQALTMCMGFGCNAAGVTGCRIIDSPRERLIAILTNSFVPCNGRFPTLTALITMFFAGSALGLLSSIGSALLLTGVVLLGVLMTFLTSWLLSRTVLKGIPSSFTLELPPYRKPQVGKVLLRSIFDRTLFVLGRAACAAAPAGILIWSMANIHLGSSSLLSLCAGFLDPVAAWFGLDGVILMAFILGFPANEIVIPIMLMAYLEESVLTEPGSLLALRELLVSHGWTRLTAACTMIFSLLHWPCSTTLLTIHRETGSLKWTFLSFLLPTAAGLILCFLVANIARIFL
ncbi:MAG: ferrous iron transport protein B [Lachnospiraceae bacterium]|nr:ferrous iron transport protein B [Lachnospiraceae bacterium]